MNSSPERQIRKFNPGTFQSDEEVIAQFVVRNRELGVVLEVLRGNIDSPSCQHILVVAPRGRGKSMLLARVAAELRADAALSETLLPVRFMEESQEVFNLADFWLDTLFHLARECAASHPELTRELRATHADLSGRWRERMLADHARAAVLDAADRLGRKLVLMVENLQSLTGDVEEGFGWKLRGELQMEPRIMLLATATSRFDRLDDVNEPYFELFRILNLEPLATDDCRRLWEQVSGDQVSTREMRPLEILTGGSPRLLVIVAEFARHRSLRQLMEELVTLVDEHTEYFRGHLEALAKTERRVYLAVIDLWQPSAAGEIAARSRLDVRTVSTMLGRLTDRGAVIVEGTGRKRRYAAAERLYSIYYKLRRERDEAAVVQNLIRFMAAIYSKAELAGITSGLRLEMEKSPVIREGILRAIAESPYIGNVLSSLSPPGIERPQPDAATRFGDSDTQEIQERAAIALIGKGLALVDIGDHAAALAAFDEVITRFGNNDAPKIRTWVAPALVAKGAMQKKLGAYAAAIKVCDEAITRFGNNDAPETQTWVAWALMVKGDAQEELGDYVAATTAYDEVIARFGDNDVPEIQVQVATTLVNKGVAQGKSGDDAAAITAFEETIVRFGDNGAPDIQVEVATALVNKGVARRKSGDNAAAIAAYDEVIARFGDNDAPKIQTWVAWALVYKGVVQEELSDHAAAITAYDEVITRFGDSDAPEIQARVARALSCKGLVQTAIGRADENLRLCAELDRRVAALPGDDRTFFAWRANWLRAAALLMQGKRPAAMGAFRSAYAGFAPENVTMMREMADVTIPRLIAVGASEHDLVDILCNDETKSGALTPLIIALHQRMGVEVRAPTEMLEVAEDIRKQIEEITAMSAPAAQASHIAKEDG